MREVWVSAAMFAGALVVWAGGGLHREAPLVGHQQVDTPDMASLETAVSLAPNDPERLAELGRAYLDRNAPGPAIAAIHRAPTAVQKSPAVMHLLARALLREGRASVALAKQQELLSLCRTHPCDPWLVSSAARHEAFLQAMVQRGVEDYRVDPLAAHDSLQEVLASDVPVSLAHGEPSRW